jgi:hypothetical protein
MSGKGYEELIELNRKIDELLARYNSLKLEVKELKAENEVLNKKLIEKESDNSELIKNYERVKISGALLGGSENAFEAKKKINELVREIDRCVALLNR